MQAPIAATKDHPVQPGARTSIHDATSTDNAAVTAHTFRYACAASDLGRTWPSGSASMSTCSSCAFLGICGPRSRANRRVTRGARTTMRKAAEATTAATRSGGSDRDRCNHTLTPATTPSVSTNASTLRANGASSRPRLSRSPAANAAGVVASSRSEGFGRPDVVPIRPARPAKAQAAAAANMARTPSPRRR